MELGEYRKAELKKAQEANVALAASLERVRDEAVAWVVFLLFSSLLEWGSTNRAFAFAQGSSRGYGPHHSHGTHD
jgi:hypothetical protein